MHMPVTLSELWSGNIAPFERCGIHNIENKELEILKHRNFDALCQTITPEQKEVFQKYVDCRDEHLFHMMESAFCEGFSLAAKPLSESLTNTVF